MFKNKKILITGGTGSWGQMLTTMLLESHDPEQIICFSRGELAQVSMRRKFNNKKIKFVIGDVRDYKAVEDAMQGIDYVFHLAAIKHVDVCEQNPQEVVKTIINGTINVARASRIMSVKKVINVSSDKAVEPINAYGMAKALGEKIIIQANQYNNTTQFVCVRGGNVMGSSGSAIPFFIDQIKQGGPITITDTRMTRFFLTLRQAISLLFTAARDSVGGETFVMKMPACKISDIARILQNTHGVVGTKVVGIRPGEKLHEVLISKNEAHLTYQYNNDYYVTLPINAHDSLHVIYGKYIKFEMAEFNSNSIPMEDEQIIQLLTLGKFI